MLQAYQANLLRELEGDPGGVCGATQSYGFLPNYGKNAGNVMGFSVIMLRHLWLNLTQMSEKEKNRLLNVPVKTLGLFGPVVGSVTHKFKRQQKE